MDATEFFTSLPRSKTQITTSYYIPLAENVDRVALTGALSEILSEFTQLEHLQCDGHPYDSCSQLSGKIPECLGGLTKLKRMIFQDGGLEGEIPHSFFENESLEVLILSNQKISVCNAFNLNHPISLGLYNCPLHTFLCPDWSKNPNTINLLLDATNSNPTSSYLIFDGSAITTLDDMHRAFYHLLVNPNVIPNTFCQDKSLDPELRRKQSYITIRFCNLTQMSAPHPLYIAPMTEIKIHYDKSEPPTVRKSRNDAELHGLLLQIKCMPIRTHCKSARK